jgi:hypothetical protein
MPRASNVFRFPLDDHSADSGLASLDAAPASSAPVSWAASQHSTFDRASRTSERAQEVRKRTQLNERLITLGLLFVAAVATAVIVLVAPSQ